MNTRFVLCLATVAVVAALAIPGNAQKKGKTRPLTTSQMMAGLIKPQLTTLKETLEAGPKDDDAWKAVATSAALLNESSYLMMDDGRCPDKTWSDACIMLKDATIDILKQVDARNGKAALAGVDGVIASCKHCHAEFKYKKQ
ncbi:MAG: hypothetical protein ACYTGL_08340 [Planctomycetota bacterium]|jgi:hypothetical protein